MTDDYDENIDFLCIDGTDHQTHDEETEDGLIYHLCRRCNAEWFEELED